MRALAKLLGHALAVSLALAACHHGAGHPAEPNGWNRIARPSPVQHNPDLCETVYEARRPPDGPFDRIRLRRLALCDESAASESRPGVEAQVLYLPGTHMNGELALLEERVAFRLYLARRGISVWSLDYRTHFVPPDRADLDFMAAWTAEVFLDDARAALRLVGKASRAPVAVAGFSRGASFACALAADAASPVAALILLDGVAPGATASSASRPPGPVAIDVGGRRLTYERRARLLARVIDDPGSPATYGSFATAGEQLEHVLYSSKTFGGRGGLSNAENGVSDVRDVARLLASYDRYWPAAARPEAAASPLVRAPLPVFAAASTNMGERFTSAVVGSAHRFGGKGAQVVVLEGWGHLDVLAGRQARERVFEPLVEWIARWSGRAN